MSKVEWWLGGGGMDFHISRLSLWWTLCYLWLVRLYVSIGTSLVDVWCLKLSYIFMPCDKNALWCLLIFNTKSMETLELMCGNSATCGEFGHKLWRLRRLCHLFSCFRFLVSITCHRHHTYLLHHTFTPHKYKCMKFIAMCSLTWEVNFEIQNLLAHSKRELHMSILRL
jgi:hypothetical protein